MFEPKKPNMGDVKLTSSGMQVEIGGGMSVGANGLNLGIGNGMNLEVGTGKMNMDLSGTSAVKGLMR